MDTEKKEIREFDVQGDEWFKAPQYLTCCSCGLCHKAEYSYSDTDGLYIRLSRDPARTKKHRLKMFGKNTATVRIRDEAGDLC